MISWFQRKFAFKCNLYRYVTVGRLDVNTTGMLLVTTDGQWCQRVAHPSSEVVKSYIVTVGALYKLREKREREGSPPPPPDRIQFTHSLKRLVW